MIADKDRSGWFGASDTNFIIGNWSTKSFENWWLQKLGLTTNDFQNKYTLAGTYYEHEIIKALDIDAETDKQILLPEYRLRVNLDANTDTTIYEIKTFKAEKGFKKPPTKYLNQVYVQMFATGLREAFIVAYPMTDDNYNNFFLEVDKSKILYFKIIYDESFINKKYLPRLIYLKNCLIKGMFPNKKQFDKEVA